MPNRRGRGRKADRAASAAGCLASIAWAGAVLAEGRSLGTTLVGMLESSVDEDDEDDEDEDEDGAE